MIGEQQHVLGQTKSGLLQLSQPLPPPLVVVQAWIGHVDVAGIGAPATQILPLIVYDVPSFV